MPINHFNAQRFSRLQLLAKQAVEGFITGLHKSPYHGFSVEFAEHRAYNVGESTRHIDWKLFGRTDKMFVKRFEEETNLRCQILIDKSGSMYYPKTSNTIKKVQFATQCAASLIYLLRSQRDAVGLSLIGQGIEWSSPAKSSTTHHNFLFSELEKLYDSETGTASSNLVEALHLSAEQIHKRSLIVIFSDFIDSFSIGKSQDKLFEALQHLKYNKHEVILFHLFDKQTEVDFELENRPYAFVDLETGEKIKVHPSDVKALYTDAQKKRIEALKLKSRQYRIDWIETDINEGVEKVLDHFLAKRSNLF